MSRPTIFSEQLSRPEVAAALREPCEDRDALLASLTDSLQADPRVRAAWLWGSFGRGEADDLSDLDPWLIVADDAVGEMGARLRQYALLTGTFVTGGEAPQNAPPGGGLFSSLHEGRHGLLHLDCYWQPESAVEQVPARAVLFDRLQEPHTAPPQPTVPEEGDALMTVEALTDEEDRIAGGIGFAWLMLSIAAKTLARHPDSDMGLMAYPRPGLEDAAGLFGLGGYIIPSDWSVPEGPRGKVECLRSLADKTARLTEVADGCGMTLSPRNAVCLNRYLDMIESILS
jgi:hypothetical protein